MIEIYLLTGDEKQYMGGVELPENAKDYPIMQLLKETSNGIAEVLEVYARKLREMAETM